MKLSHMHVTVSSPAVEREKVQHAIKVMSSFFHTSYRSPTHIATSEYNWYHSPSSGWKGKTVRVHSSQFLLIEHAIAFAMSCASY